MFPSKLQSPAMSEEDVMRAAKWPRRAPLGAMRSSGCADTDKELYNVTKEERDKNWLKGPASEEELVKELGPLFVVNNRFP